MINKDQSRKKCIKISSVYPSDEPNPTCYNRNMFLSYDEGRNNSADPDDNKDVKLVPLELSFVNRYQVIMTSRDQGRNWGLKYPGFPQIMIPI